MGARPAPLYVSFYTIGNGYEAEAAELVRSLDALECIWHRGKDREIVAGEMQCRVGESSHPIEREVVRYVVAELGRVGPIVV